MLRWLFTLTKRTRAALRQIETTSEGVASDFAEMRANFRQRAGLPPLTVPALPDAAAPKKAKK